MGVTASRPSAQLPGSNQPIRKLSVVIPALNEAENIQHAIDSVRRNHVQFPVEVVVVDGGSTDGTGEVARQKGAKVLTSRRGRGLQLNVGWRATDGDWLLFLHADSHLPEGYGGLIQEAILKRNSHNIPHSWGCFRSIHTDLAPLQSWLLESGVGLRTALLRRPYGDQGLFVSRKAISGLGGFKEWPFLEDVELVGRLNQLSPPAIVPASIQTSGRRWQQLGFWRTLAVNQAILLGWRLGVPVDKLASWYYPGRRS